MDSQSNNILKVIIYLAIEAYFFDNGFFCTV